MTKSEGIPTPTAHDGYSAAELAQRERDLAILDADPRSAGPANRPAWLVRRVRRVRRVLSDARSK